MDVSWFKIQSPILSPILSTTPIVGKRSVRGRSPGGSPALKIGGAGEVSPGKGGREEKSRARVLWCSNSSLFLSGGKTLSENRD